MKSNAILVLTLEIFICISFSSSTELILSKESVKYSANLYKDVAKQESSSFMISPLSLKVALGMLASGAKGNTQKELLKVLSVKRAEDVTETAKNLAKTDASLLSANKIYMSKGSELNSEYTKKVSESFKSEVENIDFGNSEQAVKKINKWIEEKSKQKLKNIVSASQVQADTILLVLNVLYFHDQWLYRFDKSKTTKEKFYVNPTKNITVDMMQHSSSIATKYYISSDLQASLVKLPYKNKDMAMYIAVPERFNNIQNLEKNIEKLLSTKLNIEGAVNIKLPRFSINSSNTLNSVLQNMGLRAAFGNADFSEMLKNKEKPIKLSTVFQSTTIDVDEDGTTAAAVSGASAVSFAGPLSIVMDRPFIFYITHHDEVLFLGRFQPS